MRRNELAELAQSLKPFIVKWFPETAASGNGGGSGALTAHSLSGPYHTGTLAESQAPWAVTNAAFSAHTSNPNAHHSRQHNILSTADHTVAGGAQLDVVGLSAPGTLALLTPSSNPGAVSALLKSSSAGNLTLPTMTATTSVTTPSLLSSGNLTITPSGGDVVVNAILSIPKAVSASTYNALIQLQDTGTQADSATGIDWQNISHSWNMARIAVIRRGSAADFHMAFSTATGGTLSEKVRIFHNGNVLVGTTTDAGYKLDVNGTGRFTGALYANSGAVVTGSASASVSVIAPLFTVASGNVTVSAPSTLLLNAAAASTVDLQINNVAQWSVNAERLNPRGTILVDIGDYNRRVRTLHAAELYVETLVAQNVLATIGGRILVAPTTKLIGGLASGATTIDVEHNNLTMGTYIYMSSVPGGVPQIEAMQVVSSATTITGGYRYTVSRNLDGTGANNWLAGDAVVSLGSAVGQGYIDLTSTSTIHNHYGPTITIFARHSTATWNGTKPVVTLGNLRSFVDYAADEYGSAAGNDLTLTPASGFAGYTIDRTNGLRLFNTDLRLYSGATEAVRLNNSVGLRLTTGAAAINTVSWHNATEGYEQATIVGNLVSGTSTLSLQARARDTVSGAFSGAAQVILSNALTASSIKLLANDGSVDGPNKYLLIGGGAAVISGVNLGVGTDDPQEKVDIRASSGLSLSVNPDYGGSTYLYTYDRVNGINSPMILRASQFLFDTGNVGVGTAPSYKLDVNGAAHASSFPTSSDARFKEALAPVTNVLARLERIGAYNFYWRQNYAGYEQFVDERGQPLLQIGFVAQEVEQEFPELISRWSHTGRDGTVTADAYSVDYARMVPVLVQAIRELRAEVAALEARLN